MSQSDADMSGGADWERPIGRGEDSSGEARRRSASRRTQRSAMKRGGFAEKEAERRKEGNKNLEDGETGQTDRGKG